MPPIPKKLPNPKHLPTVDFSRPKVIEPRLRKPVRLGINPLDLDQLSHTVWGPILKDRVAFHRSKLEPVDLNRKDEIAAVFTCPILEAALVLDKFLSETRAINEVTKSYTNYRVYIHRGADWVKLPKTVVFTLYDEETDGWVLNPEVFPLEKDEPPPPPYEPVVVPDFSLFKRRY